MNNTIARRLMVGASTFCFLRLCAIAPQAKAQSVAPGSVGFAPSSSSTKSNPTQNKALDLGLSQSTALLMPLSSQSQDTEMQRVRLSQVANSLNTQIAAERAIAAQPIGFQLSDLPIVSDLVDEDGDIDMAKGLPFSVGLGDVMGQTGIVLSTDF